MVGAEKQQQAEILSLVRYLVEKRQLLNNLQMCLIQVLEVQLLLTEKLLLQVFQKNIHIQLKKWEQKELFNCKEVVKCSLNTILEITSELFWRKGKFFFEVIGKVSIAVKTDSSADFIK